jgi:hypothetical protein
LTSTKATGKAISLANRFFNGFAAENEAGGKMVSGVSVEVKQKYLINVGEKKAKGVEKGKDFASVLKPARSELYIVEYWKGRTLLANGNIEGAKELLESLKKDVLNVICNYHGQDRVYGLMAGAIMAHMFENDGKKAALDYMHEEIKKIATAPEGRIASHNTNAIIALLEVASCCCGMEDEARGKVKELFDRMPISYAMAMIKIAGPKQELMPLPDE